MKVVFLGCTDNYGLGFSANVTKIGYMAKGLTEAGAVCAIHNGIIGSTKVEKDQTATVDGFSVTTLMKRGNQLFSYVRNVRRLYRYLKSEKVDNEINLSITTMPLFHIYFIYWFISKLLGYKFVVISHEWGPTLKSAKKVKYILLCLYAKVFGWFADAILPISEYIIERIRHFNKPYFKVPILAEFEKDSLIEVEKNNTFVYCAAVYFKRIILMLIDAYKIYSEKGGGIMLTLVLNGPEKLMAEIQGYIDNIGLNNKVVIKTKLPYDDLLNEYKKAIALIIPLNPSYEQDEARFSQKIAEYVSSGSAILTNKVGEISYYFKKDEFVACDFSEESFADAFKWIEFHNDDCTMIGRNGYRRGQLDFNYKNVGKGLYEFLQILE